MVQKHRKNNLTRAQGKNNPVKEKGGEAPLVAGVIGKAFRGEKGPIIKKHLLVVLDS